MLRPRAAVPQPRTAPTRRARIDALHRPATLTLPAQARGLVLCAHVGWPKPPPGTTTAQYPPGSVARLHCVARVLAQHRLATLIVDLLDKSASRDAAASARGRASCPDHGRAGAPGAAHDPQQDLPLLTERAVAALDWAAGHDDLAGLRAGLCAADVGAAVALIAATRRPARVAAVVGCSGRPDLAGAALARVAVPTLLIVAGNDLEALAVNRRAMLSLSCEKRLEVVPGAGHGFDEPGALQTMGHLAGAWLAERLGGSAGRH